MSIVVDCLVDLGFDAGKTFMKDKKQEKEAKDSIREFIQRQEKINEMSTQAEEIDFQGLVAYLTSQFLEDIKICLFGEMRARDAMKQTILSKAYDYANAHGKVSKDRVEKLINDSLDILYSYYRSQMSQESLFVITEITTNLAEQYKTQGERLLGEVKKFMEKKEEKTPDASDDKRTNDTQRVTNNEMFKSLHKFVMKNYIKERYRRETLSKQNIEDYSKLFEQCVDVQQGNKKKSFNDKNIFEFVRQDILSQDSENLLKVVGPDGTGKSTFLSILYIYLYEYCVKNGFVFYPFYINLHYYDTKITPDNCSENDIKTTMAKDLDKLKEIAQNYPEIPYIIMIDGNENYSKTILKLTKCFKALISDMSGHKKIVCIGDKTSVYSYRQNSQVINLPTYQRMLYTFNFKSISIRKEKELEEFLKCFISIEGNDELLEPINHCLKTLELEEVDLNILNIFKLCYDSDVFNENDSISNLYKNYCMSYLDDAEQMNEVAQMAYDYFINNKELNQVEIANRNKEWNLIHQHKTISNFLIAYCYVEKFKQYRKKESVADLEYLFSTEVNVFIKSLINEGIDVQKTIFNQCKKVYEEGGILAKAQALYMMGRINCRNIQQSIIYTLQKYYKHKYKNLNENFSELNEQEERDEHLLLRSIIISLVRLGEKDKGKDYLKMLLDCRMANQINRSFHLEYYGDIPRKPDNRMYSYEDDGSSDMKITYDILLNQITKHLAASTGTEDSSFQINLFTLCSLVQMRLVKKNITESRIQEVKKIIDLTLDKEQGNIDKDLIAYLQMLKEDIENKTYSPHCLYDKLYRLKNTERTGWQKGIIDSSFKRPYENVAEHIYYTWMLGVLYLPDEAPKEAEYKKYNKKEVLDAILIHDWAEVDVGDVVPEEQSETHEEEEDFRMRVLLMHDTYEDIGNLTQYKKVWNIYGKNSNNINGRLAYELDKIQAIYQFCLYQECGAEFVEKNALKWKKEKNKIKTALGKSILKKILQERFKMYE